MIKMSITRFLSLLIVGITFSIKSFGVAPKDSLYYCAYQEIKSMLDGEKELNLKRAVFLGEWAYLGDQLNYESYSNTIESIRKPLTDFMVLNGLDKHPIGGNIALFEFFTNPSPLNGNRPYEYDFDDFGGKEDRTKLFVTKLMATHSGQCRSLPLFYKILANEIGAEAFIAYAPNHSFIRHKSEEGDRLVCVELTNKTLPREVYMIESMSITETAIEKGTYMKPCDDREIIIDLLVELAGNHFDEYGMSHFALEVILQVLEYNPEQLRALFVLNNMLVTEGQKHRAHLNSLGLEGDEYLYTILAELEYVHRTIDETGHVDMPAELYEEWVRSVQEEMERQKNNVSH